jgi:glucokinase
MADDTRVYAGIDIGGTSIKFGLFDSEGKILYREQRPSLVEKGATPLMHLIGNIGERLLYFAADEELDVRWLGVGSPGAIDFSTGVVTGPSPNIPGWEGMEIGPNLSDRLNIPVYVDNDANAMALAEARYGAASGSDSVVCATVGTGIGGGLILGGKVWRGAHSSGAELGHMSIDYDGPKCSCGQRGCVEAFCSSEAILARTRNHLKGGLTPAFQSVLEGDLKNLSIKKIFAALGKGDEVAEEVIDETGRYLGVALAGVVNLLNPETIVIGGGIAEGGGGFIDAVIGEIKQRAFSSAVEKLRVVRATLGNNAGFIGAGLLGEQ